MYKQKIEGEICSDCGKAKYVKNPKSGKVFCANKCWLTGEQPTQQVAKPLPPAQGGKSFEQERDSDLIDMKEREKILGQIRTNVVSGYLASGRPFNAAGVAECELATMYAMDGARAVPFTETKPTVVTPSYDQITKGKNVWDSLVETQ